MTDVVAPQTDNATTEAPVVDATVVTEAPDLAAQVAALTATVASLNEANKAAQAREAAATAQAEATRVASLSEAERVAEDRKAIDAERKAMVTDARKSAADKLGIRAEALPLVPDCDPRTPEGAKAIEDWAKANGWAIKATAQEAANPLLDMAKSATGKLADVLSGKVKNPMITQDSLKRTYNA